ncbi:VOC family protein [Streptomyces sp. NPDC005799]|uniref:VOC family protein n=1 Tax=Streptomyces sp. NPDC005799 TaxID=3154678 RepID=UPI0033C7CEB3
MPEESPVRELRLVVTASDYDEALRFYRDVLGMPERAAFSSPDGRVTLLEAGRATLELTDPGHAAFIDEVEVGRRVAGPIRVAFQVDDSTAVTARLAAAGADVLAEPTRTPWNSLNSRLEAPGALQLTLFEELGQGLLRKSRRPPGGRALRRHGGACRASRGRRDFRHRP